MSMIAEDNLDRYHRFHIPTLEAITNFMEHGRSDEVDIRTHLGIKTTSGDMCDEETVFNSTTSPPQHEDPVLFLQVFQNLLENISKYTASDTKVTLSALPKGKNIELIISDNGPGIPEKDQERLFDKFTRLESGDASIAGTGLGLSICRAIVELHKGTITLENNREGGGLSVIITLKDYKIIEEEMEE